MTKYAGSSLFERVSTILKKVDEDQKVELLVPDFNKLVYNKYKRRDQTLSWKFELKKQAATFRSYYCTGMSNHRSFDEISVRINLAINAIEKALTDNYTNPDIIDTMKEVKRELELVLEEEYSYMSLLFELAGSE